MSMRAGAAALIAGGVSLGLLAAIISPPPAAAQETPTMVQAPSDLKKFNVTIRRFDPEKGAAQGTDFVLPVDSPDEEHAVAAAMSNAVAFTRKLDGSHVLPVAFTCTAVSTR